jgi:uncharacterized membrane protein (UPF0136 family)
MQCLYKLYGYIKGIREARVLDKQLLATASNKIVFTVKFCPIALKVIAGMLLSLDVLSHG